MKFQRSGRLKRVVLPGLVLVLFAGASGRAMLSLALLGVPQTPVSGGIITGQVLEAGTSRPLRRAVVSLRRATDETDRAAPASSLNRGGRGGNQLGPQQNSPGSDSNYRTETAPDGTYFLSEIAAGDYMVVVTLEPYLPLEFGQRTTDGHGTPVHVGPGQRLESINLRMFRAGVIAGTIRDEDGSPKEDVVIQALTMDYVNGQPVLTAAGSPRLTNDAGEFRLYYFNPGDYYVAAIDLEDLLAQAPSNGRGGGRSTQELLNVLSATRGNGTNRGGFARGAGAVTSAFMLWDFAQQTNRLPDAFLGGGGTPTPGVDGPKQQPQYVPLFYPGTTDVNKAAPVRLSPGAEARGVDLTLKRITLGTLSGVVRRPAVTAATRGRGRGGRGTSTSNAFGGGPQGRIALTLTPKGIRVAGSRSAGVAGEAGADGTFQLTGVAPGAYNLMATLRDNNVQMVASQQIEVGSSGNASGIQLTLRPVFDIPGRVHFDGQPPEGFQPETMRVELQLPDVSRNGNSQLEKDGTFVLYEVAPGLRYRVAITNMPPAAYLIAGRTGTTDALSGDVVFSEDRALQLQIGFSTARFEVTVREGERLQSGVIAALVPKNRNRTDLYRTSTTESDGRAVFANVAPGDYKVFAWEELPAGALLNSSFLRKFEDHGRPLHIDKGTTGTDSIQVIQSEFRY